MAKRTALGPDPAMTPRLPERYRGIEVLGEGASSTVWLAEDLARERARVAVKMLATSQGVDAALLRREFSILGQLRHVHLVEVRDLGETPDGLPYLCTEWIDGGSIVEAVAGGGERAFFDLAAEGLRALGFLHDFGVVHGDIKPANLLVRRRPRLGTRLAVLDFGLSVRLAESRPLSGTTAYMAAELFDGATPSPRSDLYAFGAVLFECLHRRAPFAEGGKLAGLVDKIRSGKRSRPAVPPPFPPGLAAWIDTLLALDPADRPSGAIEALARLNAACSRDAPLETRESRAARLASGPPPGREEEVERLRSILARADRPRLVLVHGPSGTGRRRLLRWLAADAAARGWDVALSPGELSPAALAEPVAASLEAVLDDLRARAARGPTLLLLDHVHGSRALGLLERVAREAGAAPLQVVAAVDAVEGRSPELRRMLEQCGQVPSLFRVDVDRLGREGLVRMIERATGSRSPAQSRVSWLVQATGGRPLAAESLLIEGAWETGRTDRPPGDLLLGGRLSALPPPALGLLEALAVVREPVAPAFAAALAGCGEAESAGNLAELEVLGLARQRDGRWEAESEALCEATLERVAPERRRELHRAAAGHLEATTASSPADPFLRARLWSGAGEPERAATLAAEAAALALDRGDPLLAAERYGFALRHLQRRDPRRAAWRLAHAGALRDANRPLAAARAFGGALRAARGRGAPRILAGQAAMLAQAGRFERALEVGERALAAAREEGDSVAEARAKETLGTVHARRGEGGPALLWLRQAVEEFAAAGDRAGEAHALQALGLAMANEGLPEARAHLESAIASYERSGARGRGLINRVGVAVLEQRAGRYDSARELLERTRAVASEHHNLLIEAVACGTLAQNAVFAGRYAAALALALEAEQQALHLGDERLIVAARSARAQALARCGRPVEAAALIDSTLAGSTLRVDPVIVATARLALAEALLADETAPGERVEAAVSAALEATRPLRDPDSVLWGLVLALELNARTGRPIAPLRAELAELERGGESWSQPHLRARAELAVASATLREGHGAEALDAARTAEATAGRHGLAATRAAALALAGKALASLGRSREAGAAFADAAAALDDAASRIDDPGLRLGFLESPTHRALRLPAGGRSGVLNRRLVALYGMIRALNSETDPERLLESILELALKALGAERGMILLRDVDSEFRVRLARNLDRGLIDSEAAFSRHIVAWAAAGRSVLSIDTLEDARFRDVDSFHGTRSLLCVPLRSRGATIGAVYLDTQNAARLFEPGDLRFLEAFSDHAALALENAREVARLAAENRRLQAVAESRVRFGNLVGRSPAMARVFELIEKVSRSELPVLIEGASGTGKELVARAIHFHGPRRGAPFVSENCAAIPETLLQSELFGHVRGAFTGAERDRTGLFEQADGGTLFLDEVGDTSPAMQAQLLRVLQESEVRPVGGEGTIPVNVRVIAATHRDLERMVAEGTFREDLLYRLQVLTIWLPPLAERREDIPLLVDHFLRRIADARGRRIPRVAADVLERIERYPWPGNVRQLENSLQRLVLLAGDEPITMRTVEADPSLSQRLRAPAAAEVPAPLSLHASEGQRIRQALEATRGNRARAARLLGISRATIYRKIAEHGLE